MVACGWAAACCRPTRAAQRNDLNWIGAFSGAMAQSASDASAAEMLPGDLETARVFGERVAQQALRLMRQAGAA